jgi:hypothetical protein
LPHESNTLAARGIGIFAVAFAGGMVLLFSVWMFFRSSTGAGVNAPVFQSSNILAQPLQPSVTHPTLPREDMAALRTRQLDHLNSEGSLPGDPNHIHIPIQRAIDLLLQRGSATMPQTPSTQPYLLDKPPVSVENRT